MLPDWAYYLTDIFISAICFAALNYFFSRNHNAYISYVKPVYQAYAIIIATTFSALFFYLFRTYEVSFTNRIFKNMQSYFIAIGCISCAMFGVHCLLFLIGKLAFAPVIMLLFFSFISALGIAAYRLFINYVSLFFFTKKPYNAHINRLPKAPPYNALQRKSFAFSQHASIINFADFDENITIKIVSV